MFCFHHSELITMTEVFLVWQGPWGGAIRSSRIFCWGDLPSQRLPGPPRGERQQEEEHDIIRLLQVVGINEDLQRACFECSQIRERRFQPKVFLTEVFGNLGSWTSAPLGHGCPRPTACFSSILRALTEVLGRDIRANDPRMSAGHPSPKLLLWADFSVLPDLGKSKRGLTNGGLSPKFLEKIGGNSFLANR